MKNVTLRLNICVSPTPCMWTQPKSKLRPAPLIFLSRTTPHPSKWCVFCFHWREKETEKRQTRKACQETEACWNRKWHKRKTGIFDTWLLLYCTSCVARTAASLPSVWFTARSGLCSRHMYEVLVQYLLKLRRFSCWLCTQCLTFEPAATTWSWSSFAYFTAMDPAILWQDKLQVVRIESRPRPANANVASRSARSHTWSRARVP